ncbi:hypothetical protein Tco_0698484 [Tanacetum coccineum]
MWGSCPAHGLSRPAEALSPSECSSLGLGSSNDWLFQRLCLYPLSEVINCYNDELKLARAFRERFDDVKTSLVEQPQRHDGRHECLQNVCEDFVGIFWEAKHQVSFVRILRLREVARVTARIALEFAPEFAYVYRLDFVECYLILLVMHFSVSLLLTPLCCDDIHDVTPRVSALAGCDRLAGEYCKIRIPIAMWPCKVEEKMTLKEVDGQTVRKSKQVIARMHYQPEFLEISGYETRKYNCGKGGIYNYGGQHNYTCATTQVDLQVGFQWIIVDALHKMAPSCRSGNNDNNNNENPNIVAIIAQQLQTILPQIVTQVTNNVNNANNGNGGNGNGGNGNGRNNGCTFKAFQSYNPKEYDRKGGATALTRWIEKMEIVIDNSGLLLRNQKVRYAASSLVNKALTWWNTQVQARGRVAAMAMAWNDFKALMVEEFCPSNEMEKLENENVRATQPTTIQNAILRAGILTDEVVSCGTLTKGSDKRKGVEESSKTRGSGKDNKKAKVGTGFMATAPPRNETVGYYPRRSCMAQVQCGLVARGALLGELLIEWYHEDQQNEGVIRLYYDLRDVMVGECSENRASRDRGDIGLNDKGQWHGTLGFSRLDDKSDYFRLLPLVHFARNCEEMAKITLIFLEIDETWVPVSIILYKVGHLFRCRDVQKVGGEVGMSTAISQMDRQS